MKMRRFTLAMLAGLLTLSAANAAQAADTAQTFIGGTTISGDTVSAEMTWTVNNGIGTLVLTNTTPTTRNAGHLLTAVELCFFDSGTPVLLTGTAVGRTVNSSGVYTDSGSVNLMTVGPQSGPTWSVDEINGDYRVNFNPDAKYAILGAPTAGSYSGANNSIKGNSGHNPFSALSATFTFDVGCFDDTKLDKATFFFGTAFQTSVCGEETDGGTPIPEPSSLAILSLAAGGLLLRVRRRI